MKNLLIVATVLLAGVSCWGAAEGTTAKLKANRVQISLADAKGRIDKAIASPAVMKAIMQHLSAEDQKQFLADVNAAIATMPASEAERTATFVAINRAALEGAQKGNVATLVAESFATVSPSALPALSESLASDLMNRATDKGRTYTDEQYVKLGQTVMAKVNARTAEVDHADVRSGFAALMFVRGSNSPKAEIVDAFVATLPESARETAKKEWFPAALAEGDAKSYDAMLAAADVEAAETVGAAEPANAGDGDQTVNIPLRIAGAQLADSLIADIAGASTDPSRTSSGAANPIFDAVTAPLKHQLPDLGVGDPMGDANMVIGEAIRGYQWQSTRY